MKLLRMSNQQINNLKTFLQRVEMKGEEAFAYVELITVLSNAKDEEKEEIQPCEKG